jgi:hypothetical protein
MMTHEEFIEKVAQRYWHSMTIGCPWDRVQEADRQDVRDTVAMTLRLARDVTDGRPSVISGIAYIGPVLRPA